MPNTNTIRVVMSTERLNDVREFVASCIHGLGFGRIEANNIVLAVDEACSNLILHSVGTNPTSEIDIQVESSPTEVRVAIRDTGKSFNPLHSKQPDMAQYFAEHRHHGLGIMLMTRVMDEIEYSPANGASSYNVLTLTKKRRP